MRPDAVLYLITQPYLSARRLAVLRDGLIAATPVAADVVRMEGTGTGPMTALDTLVAGGARDILVQPVGLPFSDSLAAWLPGALAHWLARRRKQPGQPEVTLSLGTDQAADSAVIGAVAATTLERADTARPLRPEQAKIDNPGWQDPPPFRHHILVCAGPRCTFREAGALKPVLDAELRRAGVMDDCLVTTTGCLFPCNQGPMVAVYPSGRWYRLETTADVARFATALAADDPLPDLMIHEVSRHETRYEPC